MLSGSAFWVGFHGFIALLIVGDFYLFKRHFTVKKAWVSTACWIAIALLFNGLVYLVQGREAGLQFLTAYLVEKSLSVDNLFVFLVLFEECRVDAYYQVKVLRWGILGAIVFRILFILSGVQLLRTFHWMVYILGAFLCFTALRLLIAPHKTMRRDFFSFLPVAKGGAGHFFVRENKRFKVTRLFVVLLLIETTDILFAIDSIPAVLAITLDPFIAYTSNIFAVIGLRSLFFALSPLLKKFTHLNYGLCAILLFIGLKMLFAEVYAIPVTVCLLVVVGILCASVLLSMASVNIRSK